MTDSLPQHTPEQLAEMQASAKKLIETFLSTRPNSVKTYTIEDEMVYCVFDWFNLFYGDGIKTVKQWDELVLHFIQNETPISHSTVMLPYENVEKGVPQCLMEFGSALAIVALYQIDEAIGAPQPSKANRLSRFNLPNRKIYEPLPVERGYVYMIHIDGVNEYKIGYTEDFQRRFAQYKSHTPPSTLWVVDYLYEANLPKDVEKSIHRLFKRFRVSGEWFRMDKSWALMVKMALAQLQSAANFYEDKDDMIRRIYQYAKDAGYDFDNEVSDD